MNNSAWFSYVQLQGDNNPTGDKSNEYESLKRLGMFLVLWSVGPVTSVWIKEKSSDARG